MKRITHLFSWMIMFILAYGILLDSHGPTPNLPQPATAVEETATPTPAETPNPEIPVANTSTDMNSVEEITDTERWKRALNPDYAAKFNCNITRSKNEPETLFWRVSEEKIGSGAPARCSEKILVTLTLWSEKGIPAHRTERALTLGTHEIASGLDAALVGIRPGGMRTVILGPDAQTHAKETDLPKPLAAALGKGHMAVITVERR